MSRSDVSVRFLKKADLDAVEDIDRQSFMTEWHSEKWIAQMKPDKGRKPMAIVGVVGGVVAGVCLFNPQGRMLAIERLAVHPRFRRMGVCRAMVAHVQNKLGVWDKSQIGVLLEENWQDAMETARRLGFKAKRLEKGSPPENGNDRWTFVYRQQREGATA